MRRENARLGSQFCHPVKDALQIINARTDAENLAATEHLTLDCLAQDNAIPGADKGAHGQPVNRRRGDE